MKVFTILLLGLLALATAKEMTPASSLMGLTEYNQENDVKNALEVVAGILVGAFNSHTSIKACYEDSMSIFDNFRNAYIALRQGSQSGVFDGLIHIGKALQKMPDAFKNCKDLGTVVQK